MIATRWRHSSTAEATPIETNWVGWFCTAYTGWSSRASSHLALCLGTEKESSCSSCRSSRRLLAAADDGELSCSLNEGLTGDEAAASSSPFSSSSSPPSSSSSSSSEKSNVYFGLEAA